MRQPRFFAFLSTRITLGVLALVIGSGIALLFLVEQNRQGGALDQEEIELGLALHHNTASLKQAVNVLRQDVLFLSRTPPTLGIVRSALNGGLDPQDGNTRASWEKRLQEIFSAFSTAHPDYYQIRFIGVADGGRDIVRIDNLGGRIEVTPPAQLRADGEQDYFKASLRLKEREVYLSDFNLNRNGGVVEQPFRPSLRAITPVFTPSGKMFGMVVISMEADAVLGSARSGLSPEVQAYVANMRGDYIQHPEQGRAFVFDLGREGGITQDFPLLQAMFDPQTSDYLSMQTLASATGIKHLAAERVYFDPAQPKRFLLLAYAVSDEVLAGKLHEIFYSRNIAAGLLVIVLIGAIVWFTLKRMFAPLKQLTKAAERVADGDFDVMLPQAGDGEIGALSDAIRAMLNSINAREAELRIAACTFETQEAIMVTDTTPVILKVNQAFCDITGWQKVDVLGKNPKMLSPDRLEKSFYEAMWATLLNTGKWSGELWARRKNGELYPRGVTITAVHNAEGQITHYVSVSSDISQRRRAEDEIRRLASNLTQQNEVLQGYKTRMEEEREVAQKLMQQTAALDKIDDPLVRFHMQAMEDFSGDLVAAARTPDNRLHVLLADGTGHGLNAALSVAPLAQLFYQMTAKGFDITTIVSEMNQRVRTYLPLPRFVAAILLSVEMGERTVNHQTIRVWNGGCPPVLLFQSDGENVHHFVSKHVALGILDRDEFSSSVEYFDYTATQGQLLLCSDGLTELQTGEGEYLGQTGLLARPTSREKRFDELLELIDQGLKGKPPADDIALVLVDFPMQENAGQDSVEGGQEAEAKLETQSYDDEGFVRDDWSFALTLTAAQLRRLDIVPLLLGIANQIEMARVDSKVFVVMAELFNNALDHGLLKLDSKLKDEEGGMERYFEERAARLERLEHGVIEIRLNKLLYEYGTGLRIYFRDSGGGFDFRQAKLSDEDAKHGRGITLLLSLCSKLEYLGNGSEVVAILGLPAEGSAMSRLLKSVEKRLDDHKDAV
jgi:PAS domain S-box-containing protein